MSRGVAVIIEPNLNRREIMSLMVHAATSIRVDVFETYDDAWPILRGPALSLVICPWSDGGEQLLTERVSLQGAGQDIPAAPLLILAKTITRSRIDACHRAGSAHLIPSEPLNLNALRNRILLQLDGPSLLSERLSRSSIALRDALTRLPALRRRLAV